MQKFQHIRDKFPCLKQYAYFDTSSVGLISTDSYNIIKKHLQERVHFGMSGIAYFENWNFVESTREKVASLLNSNIDEVFFGLNSSDIINVLATGLQIKASENVVTSGLAFPSLTYSWMNQKKNETRIVEHENGAISLDSINKNVDKNTKIISVAMVEHSSGFKHDLKLLGKYCKDNNIFLAVDTTQALGALKVDVKEMNIDFITSSTYKWLSNVFGLGIGYVSERLQSEIHQQYAGWSSFKNKTDYQNISLEFDKGARRYELGGLNFLAIKSLSEFLDMYDELGADDIEKQIITIRNYLDLNISRRKYIRKMYDFKSENLSHIIYLKLPKEFNLSVSKLQEKGIRVNVLKDGVIRVGIHFFNNHEDVDKMFSCFDELKLLYDIRG